MSRTRCCQQLHALVFLPSSVARNQKLLELRDNFIYELCITSAFVVVCPPILSFSLVPPLLTKLSHCAEVWSIKAPC